MTRPRVIARATWRDVWHPGINGATLSALEDGWRLTGRADVRFAEGPTKFSYRIDCNRAWEPREAEITLRDASGPRRIGIEVTEDLVWTVGGLRNAELRGCTDLDLAATPATNTLTLKRLGLEVGESRELLAAWILFPDIVPIAARQRYTRVSEHLYHFEAPLNGFVSDFEVDDDAVVTHYPATWDRIEAPARRKRKAPRRRG